MRRVSPARRATIPRACSAWRRPAPTPTTPPACATMATSWARSRSGASPAPCARWVRACCTAASSTTTRCARSATTTRTRTRRAPGSPASPATPAKGTTPSFLAPQPLIRFVRVSQFPCGDIVTIQASSCAKTICGPVALEGFCQGLIHLHLLCLLLLGFQAFLLGGSRGQKVLF